MADAQDLKSWDLKKSCGFESHHRYHFNIIQYIQCFCKIHHSLKWLRVTHARLSSMSKAVQSRQNVNFSPLKISSSKLTKARSNQRISLDRQCPSPAPYSVHVSKPTLDTRKLATLQFQGNLTYVRPVFQRQGSD